MTMYCKSVLILLLLVVNPTFGYFSFRRKIPNGEAVPHPCKANYMWQGVGHTNPSGGGERNPFGEDFDNAGQKWTEQLCRFDSDGDGMTNGQELGDPDCKWTEGSVPDRVTGISHPGYCTPYGSQVCAGRNENLACSIESFGESCDVIKAPEIRTMDLRFKEHEIPNTETNYYCQYFDLPGDQDFHIVANEGLVDNRNVLHHILMYGCPDSFKSSPTDDSPNPCSMGGDATSCTSVISAWTVGLAGRCRRKGVGFRIGATGFKKVKLEMHYNNPQEIAGYRDKSGMRIYFLPARPDVADLSTFAVGQSFLEIPPGQESVTFEGTCPASCTRKMLQESFFVVNTLNHMHYMGRSQKTEVRRNGQVVKVLADDPRYNYDSPEEYRQEEPFEVFPGDEIVTTCTYGSMSKKKTVFFGEGTNDEMCLSFLTVYPASAINKMQWCVSTGPLSFCERRERTPVDGCDWSRFVNLTNPEMREMADTLRRNCNLDGKCRPECKEYLDTVKDHACLTEDFNALTAFMLSRYNEGSQFLGRLHSCPKHQSPQQKPDWKDCIGDASAQIFSNAASLPFSQITATLAMVFVAMATRNTIS